jgi:hypothetical protein
MNVLIIRYNLNCSLHLDGKDQYRIYIKQVSMPLLRSILRSEVIDGAIGKLLETFGVTKKFDRRVILSRGPNKKANRYLVFQYKRLIKTIEGQTVQGTISTPAHVV